MRLGSSGIAELEGGRKIRLKAMATEACIPTVHPLHEGCAYEATLTLVI